MHSCQQLRRALTKFYSSMHDVEVIMSQKKKKQWETDYEEGNALENE